MSRRSKRVAVALAVGSVLGVFCILGVGHRVGYDGNGLFLFSVWYNRLLMGLVVGLAGEVTLLRARKTNVVVRGLLLGTVVTLASSLSTEFRDGPAFFAGMVYGPIIDVLATWLSERGATRASSGHAEVGA